MSVTSVIGAAAILPVTDLQGLQRAASANDRPVTDVGASVPRPVQRPVAAPAVDHLRQVSAQIENFVRSSGRDLQFRVNDASGRVVVSVRDAATGELIRQMPSEEALRIAEHLGAATSLSDVPLIADQEI